MNWLEWTIIICGVVGAWTYISFKIALRVGSLLRELAR